MKHTLGLAWKGMALCAVLTSSLGATGCSEAPIPPPQAQGEPLDDGSYTRTEDECDPDELIEALEDLSDWSFDRDCMDKTHPKYCELVQHHYDAYQKYVDNEMDTLVFAEIEIRIVNAKHPDGHAAYTDNHADGTSTITHYNPNAANVVKDPCK